MNTKIDSILLKLVNAFDAPARFPNFISNLNLTIKRTLRNTFGNNYFKLRYLNSMNVKLDGQVYKNSIDSYTNNVSPLFFSESKIHELFEVADKAKFLSASLIQIDIQEVNTIDNYKEAYPYTVYINNYQTPYAKILKMIKYRDLYLMNQPDYLKVEIEKCFEKLENYIKVYETIFLLSSYSEDLKLYVGRLSNIKQKESLINIITKVYNISIQNFSDIPESLNEELYVLLENYKTITTALEEYPLWKTKFEEDVNKQLAMINIRFQNEKIFEVIDQQKSFKQIYQLMFIFTSLILVIAFSSAIDLFCSKYLEFGTGLGNELDENSSKLVLCIDDSKILPNFGV